MEAVFVVVGLLALLWFRQYRYARRVTELRARQLSTITGTPADEIEREILQRRITPGDWAREHGLDPLTFGGGGNPPARTFGERDVPEPDWLEVSDFVSEDERRISSCSGWTVSNEDPINHPVSLYLTDSALYVSVKPDTMLPKAEIRRWSKSQIVGCDTASQPDGGTRLMVAFRRNLSAEEAPVGSAYDLRPLERGSEFGKHARQWFDSGFFAPGEGPPPAPVPPPAEPLRKKGRLPSRPDGR